MGARKSKRQLIRDEKRKKKRDREVADDENRATKRQRVQDGEPEGDGEGDGQDYIPLDDGNAHEQGPHVGRGGGGGGGQAPEREFFGMLADEEQEYFRRADELLELNDFGSAEDRDVFLENVYKEAEGKELKLASSQSCSRLMERLILLSNTRQKKHLFEAFAGHFASLVTHRFASHCCEKLFIQSAPVVTQELANGVEEAVEEGSEEAKPAAAMEELFLLTLDELEAHLTYIMSDRFASHTLRVLLVVLSGRPLDQVSTKSLIQSKKKEHITVAGASALSGELASDTRAVPDSFALAIRKIIADTTAAMDSTALRVLATHPTGNPVLQLLLDLDLSVNQKKKKSKKGEKEEEQTEEPTLLERLLPGAPASLSSTDSPAYDLVNTLLYDPIGSRLLETLISNCPGRIFKALNTNILAPRIHSFLRNDIASYPAIKALNRMSKEDLVEAVNKTLSQVPVLVEKGRFNVLKALFERCDVRNARPEIDTLLKAVCAAYEAEGDALVTKLCFLDADESAPKKDEPQGFVKNKSAMVSHGSQLVITLLGIHGSPQKAIQKSLLALSSDDILKLATAPATANVLVKALETPSQNPVFHKSLVAALMPHAVALAASQQGHNVLNAVIAAPSRGGGDSGGGIAVPFHLKEAVMARLGAQEKGLRDSWTGRSVWRSWRGDLWKNRRSDWVRWAKEVDPEDARVAATPRLKAAGPQEGGRGGGRKGFGGGRANPNMVGLTRDRMAARAETST
ncbi:uncharacterized protein E0L32_002670 [Thyridium curvatum]|uniref:Nucleolar protein 9 n=1 Tax=Thyridium curvatum TaxID=1093900 RepID=A0A507BLQ1_9PEZI|nr:uncharacterized protein E0L32_002670 [Thyridium curvatum]TPX18161.1 hypothetical protein E0L32_002670 [Thyridium curvatum]